MFKQNALRSAIIAATATSIAANAAQEIEEVVVTATKRQASSQDIPVAIRALGSESMDQNNIGNFDDYIRHLPGATGGGRGPGQSTIYIRGMAVQPITVMLSGAQGTMPNVALYIDEQPVTAPGRNIDVYTTDLNRVEVLAGPQGTLFGASSQAGTIRLITNKPKVGVFEAGFEGSVSDTHDGEMSNTAEVYLNLPVSDSLAFRAAMYSVRRGGYIDNVQGQFTTDPSVNPDSSLNGDPNVNSTTTFETANNSTLAEDDFNDSFYQGARLSAKKWINEDWDLLLQYTQQDLGSDGVFDYDEDVGDLEVERFFPDELDDSFQQTSWTLEGRMDQLELLYTGAYLEREIEQSVDYTGYNNSGAFVGYYTCNYDTAGYDECLTPVKGFRGQQDHTRQTHEFRVNTPVENRWRVTAGIFYDDFEIETQDDFYYLATPELGFAPNGPIPTADNINDDVRPIGVAFFNDITRTEEQIAVFGEFSYDFTPDLTGTIGFRYYDLESDFFGSSNFATKGPTDGDAGRDYDRSGGHTDDPLEADDIIPKLNLSYYLNQDVMLYGTYSEGYRPGGFNRGGGLASVNPAFPTVSVTYDTDDVVNYEFGWKTTLMEGALRFNGNAYFIEWTDMQISRFDPQNVSILTFIENSADSEIQGLEMNATWLYNANLMLTGAISYNDTEVTETSAQSIELVPEGSQLPLTPEVQATARARYEWQLDNRFDAFWQLGAQYSDRSFSSLVAAERRKQGSYITADAAAGVQANEWGVELYIENITDRRADLFVNNQDDIERITTNRPRTVGLRVSFDYSM